MKANMNMITTTANDDDDEEEDDDDGNDCGGGGHDDGDTTTTTMTTSANDSNDINDDRRAETSQDESGNQLAYGARTRETPHSARDPKRTRGAVRHTCKTKALFRHSVTFPRRPGTKACKWLP